MMAKKPFAMTPAQFNRYVDETDWQYAKRGYKPDDVSALTTPVPPAMPTHFDNTTLHAKGGMVNYAKGGKVRKVPGKRGFDFGGGM